MDASPLTSTNLLAAACGYLADADYAPISSSRIDGLETMGARFFEDDYRVVMVLVFDTWTELRQRWTQAQDSLVELISAHMSKAVEKSWDGYLTMLTLDPCPPSSQGEIDKIRYDTFRVRKLVAAGDELRSLGEVERAIRPLLPIEVDILSDENPSAFSVLPDLLASQGIERDATEHLLKAFADRTSLVEALHSLESEE